MQNVGAAALFLPGSQPHCGAHRSSDGAPVDAMGFCAILGGTITMVGSSPLILLNDLILTSNKALPAEHQMETWSLFSVTPIGLVLLASGIAYFVLVGRFVLPGRMEKDSSSGANAMDYFQRLYGLDYALYEAVVPADSVIVGKLINDIEGTELPACHRHHARQ